MRQWEGLDNVNFYHSQILTLKGYLYGNCDQGRVANWEIRHCNSLIIALEQRLAVAFFGRVPKLRMVFAFSRVFFLKDYLTNTICETKSLKYLLPGSLQKKFADGCL